MHQIGIEKNGSANVLSVNHLLYADSSDQSLISSLAAVRHANGRDWWILAKENYSDGWLLFLYDPSGIRLHHKLQAGMPLKDLHAQPYANDIASLVFSRDGSRLVLTNAEGLTQVFEFDRCEGSLSLLKIIPKHKNVKYPDHYYRSGSFPQFTEHGNGLLLSSSCNRRICQNYIFFADLTGSGLYARPQHIYEADLDEFLYGKIVPNPLNPKKMYVFSKSVKRLAETLEIELDESGNAVKRIGYTSLKFSHDGEHLVKSGLGTRSPALYPNYRLGAQPLKEATRAGDTLYVCGTDSVGLGVMPKKYVKYEWFPSDGLSSDTIANPTFYPERAGRKDSLFQFVLTAKGLPYSCWDGETMTDTVWVKIIPRHQSPCTYTSSEVLPLPEKVNLISLYPNPASEIIKIRFNEQNHAEIKLEMYSTTGVRIYEGNIRQSESEVSVKGFASGVYLCKFSDANGQLISTQKVMIR